MKILDFIYKLLKIIVLLFFILLVLSTYFETNFLDISYADTKSITPTNINVFVNDGIGANSSVGSYTTRNLEIGAVSYRYAQVTNINKSEITSEADVTFRFRYNDGQFKIPRDKQYALFFSVVNSLNAEPSVLVSTGGTEVSCFALSSTNGSTSRPFGHFTNFYCPIFQSYSDNLFINFTYHNFNVNMDSFYIGISSSFSYIPLSDNTSISSQIGSMSKNQEQTNKELDEANKKLEETNKQLGDLNDNLTDDDTSNLNGSDYFDTNDFVVDNESDNKIAEIINLPISILNSLIDVGKNSCVTYSLPFLSNYNLRLPCINISKWLGNDLVNVIDVLCCFSLCGVWLTSIFELVQSLTSLENPYRHYYTMIMGKLGINSENVHSPYTNGGED